MIKDDLISRSEPKKRFDEREADDIELYGVRVADCFQSDEANEIVDQMPTVDPESLRPKGRWEHPNGYVVINGFVCSECGQEELSYRAINPRPGGVYLADENGNFYYPPKMNYCPNCGAKMEGEK